MADFQKERMKNGMTLLFERRNLPITSVLIATRAGAIHETADNKGIAHFTEHMTFKASKKREADEISSAIEKVGGIMNAFTANEITAFWCKIPSKHFSTGVDIISDIVFNPKFLDKDIKNERPVILREEAMYHDNPQRYVFEKQQELLYGGILGMPIIGFKKTLLKMNRESFLGWHKYYCPENTVACVVGNADFGETKRLLEKFMGKPAQGLKLPEVHIERKTGNFFEKRSNITQTQFSLGFHIPTLRDNGRYPSEIFSAIIGEGMSSKLFREVREKRGLAYSVKCFLEQERDYGHAIIYAGIEKKNMKKVKELVLKEIKSMGKITARELDEAKEQKIGNWELELDACEKTAINLTMQEITTKAEDFYKYPEKISDVKLQDVRNLAKIQKYSLAVVMPK